MTNHTTEYHRMNAQNENVVTAAEINEYLYDPFFKNDVRSLLEFMEEIAKKTFVSLKKVCIGVGYKGTEKNISSFIYLHDPEEQLFQKYYDDRFEYPRVSFWGIEHYKAEHQFWFTYDDVVRLCEETIKNKTTSLQGA